MGLKYAGKRFTARLTCLWRRKESEWPVREISENPETDHDPRDGPCTFDSDIQAKPEGLTTNPTEDFNPQANASERQEDHSDGIESKRLYEAAV
jgi:hypothetical protein